MSLLQATGGNVLGRISVGFGTVINAVVPPNRDKRTRIASLNYLPAGTAHTLTFLRPIGKTGFTAATAAAGTVLSIIRNPGPDGTGLAGASPTNNDYPQGNSANLLAGSDLVAIREVDGVTRIYTASAVTGLSVTVGALTAGVDTTSTMWMLGVLADTEPATGLAHPTRLTVASALNTYSGTVSGVLATHKVDEPILIQSDNATATGAFNSVEYAYVPAFN